jgi:hypothetical protein
MNPLRFLADEDVSHDLLDCLRGIEPAIDVVVIGEPGLPPKGTPDPVVLLTAEALGRAVISGDRSTLTRHLADHFRAGHHTCGVILLRGAFPVARLASELYLIWFATTPDEWIDRTDYIPY